MVYFIQSVVHPMRGYVGVYVGAHPVRIRTRERLITVVYLSCLPIPSKSSIQILTKSKRIENNLEMNIEL